MTHPNKEQEAEDTLNCGKRSPAGSVERSFKQALTPFEEFVHDETSSGILLLVCTVIAMIVANSSLFPLYNSILHTKVSFGYEGYYLSHSLHHWINDGLMALFFFTVGLEIKREILVGELAEVRQAILPIFAAIGGMVVPACVYIMFNLGTDGIGGWGVPMATDIAFALGVVAMLGPRIPRPLVGFLLALAIVDDLGAVLVIAAFYTEQINVTALGFATLAFMVLLFSNIAGIRRPFPYIVFGFLLWVGMLESGVHATLAGVLTALTVPANSLYAHKPFICRMKQLTKQYEATDNTHLHIMQHAEQQKLLKSMEHNIHHMESPLQRMEHKLHLWVAFCILPLFALANAGIPIHFSTLPSTLADPVTLGIICGLLGGKCCGIFLFSWLVLRFGIAKMPHNVTMSQLASISLLAGIGFTMSIFIAGLAFSNETYLLNAKTGILVASLLAGVGGYMALYLTTTKEDTN